MVMCHAQCMGCWQVRHNGVACARAGLHERLAHVSAGTACGGGLGEARMLLRVASVMPTSMRALWAAIIGAAEAWGPPLHASA